MCFEKRFLEWENMASTKISRHFLHDKCRYIKYVFFVQLEINLHLWVFQKAGIALAEPARPISAFLKTHKCKLILSCTKKPYD